MSSKPGIVEIFLRDGDSTRTCFCCQKPIRKIAYTIENGKNYSCSLSCFIDYTIALKKVDYDEELLMTMLKK